MHTHASTQTSDNDGGISTVNAACGVWAEEETAVNRAVHSDSAGQRRPGALEAEGAGQRGATDRAVQALNSCSAY